MATSPSDPTATYRCRLEIEVRYRDLDANGHVNNAVYFTYFEQARIAYTKAVRGWDRVTPRDLGLVIAEASCRYKSPVFLGDVLIVNTRVSTIRHSSFTMEYEVLERQTGRLVATGTTVQVLYDFEQNCVRRVTPEARQIMERYEAGAD